MEIVNQSIPEGYHKYFIVAQRYCSFYGLFYAYRNASLDNVCPKNSEHQESPKNPIHVFPT